MASQKQIKFSRPSTHYSRNKNLTALRNVRASRKYCIPVGLSTRLACLFSLGDFFVLEAEVFLVGVDLAEDCML